MCKLLINVNNTINVIGFCLLVISSASSHKCYICGTSSNLPSCDNFDPNNNIYAKDCPQNSKGCSIQKYGDSITKAACEDHGFNDCQTANNVDYCYCSYDFCNNGELFNSDTSDDEDMNEGSGGLRNNFIKTTKETVFINPAITNVANTVESNYFFIIALLIFN